MSINSISVLRGIFFCPNIGFRFVSAFSSEPHTNKMHQKCRGKYYPLTKEKILRFEVPDEKVNWSESFPEYSPQQYTSPHILAKPPYADPDIGTCGFSPKWNSLDGKVNRVSHVKPYEVVDGYPRNVCGRTGVRGRGVLGRWGPNHAADPVVTRWKVVNGNKVIHSVSGRAVLEFVCVERRDSGEWAIPGGMVDPGERVTTTLIREFQEEALNALEMTPAERQSTQDHLTDLFSGGHEIYSGYVDDPRNTDNAWMETVAFNFHEDGEEGGVLHSITLEAGDDARSVRWAEVSSGLNLYASHSHILRKVAERLNAHW